MQQKKPSVPYILTEQNVTVHINSRPYTVHKTHDVYARLIEAIKKQDSEEIMNCIDIFRGIKKYSNGHFQAVNGTLLLDGEPLPEFVSETLTKKVLKFMNDNLPCEPLLKFVERLMKNERHTAVKGLYECLQRNHHPLTEDGCFLAYKRVRNDYKDLYSGTFDNSPGKHVSIDPQLVDDDCSVECGRGLHVASHDYATKSYRTEVTDARVILVKVDPQFVIAVPRDYNFQKMRVSEYVVLEDVTEELKDQIVKR